MAGQGRLDGDLGGFGVADFTDHDMSGSWRRMERRALANERPIFLFDGTWLMPGTWNSTGSSTVTMLYIGLLSSLSAE